MSLKTSSTKTKYVILFSLSVFTIGCVSTPVTKLSIPEWYGKSVSDSDYFYFYGEGNSLANAKLIALSDLNQQLLSDVKSTISYQISTSNEHTSRQSNSSVSSSGVKMPIPLPRWSDTRLLDNTFYVKGSLSNKKFILQLDNTVNYNVSIMNFEPVIAPSISNFLYFKKNKEQAQRTNALINVLSSICNTTCDLERAHHWQRKYEELLAFPSRNCIRIKRDTSPELTLALKSHFIQEGFIGQTMPCLEVSADFTPKYQRKDNLKWAEGWLNLSISAKHSAPVVGRTYLIGKSELSYILAFQNSLESLNKNGLFSSLQK